MTMLVCLKKEHPSKVYGWRGRSLVTPARTTWIRSSARASCQARSLIGGAPAGLRQAAALLLGEDPPIGPIDEGRRAL